MTRTQRQIEEHRKGEACIEVRDPAGRPCAGVPVWVEQETHAFVFGCVAPDVGMLPPIDRQRCADRLQEVFNQILPADPSNDPAAGRVEVPNGVALGPFRVELDRRASGGLLLDVHLQGQSLGLGTEGAGAAAERVAALYSLCFAHPAVRGVFWHGFWDGEPGVGTSGLLRLDFAPRPAFRYLQKLVGTIWHTRARGETDQEGRFRFRGFLGDYRVAARDGEETRTALVACRGTGGIAGVLTVASIGAH